MNATAPFVPTSIRIFPLSHVETTQPQPNKPSRPVVVLHLELKDAYGDAAKALGRLQVTLGRSASGLDPSLEQQELRWDVSELLDPESNAALFDPATRTYRVQLDAPAWVLETIEGTTRGGRSIPPGAVRVRVAFALGTRELIEEGEPIFLTDEFTLQK